MSMSEEQLKKEINKAAGNNAIEGHTVSDDERELILRIFNKYKGDYGEKAIDSLLYGLSIGIQEEQGDKRYGKTKK